MAKRDPFRYQPDAQPPVAPELRDWLLRELTIIGTLIDNPRVTETFAEPAKREPFVLLLADGTSWNPGSGRGIYFWDPAVSGWHFVG